MTAYRLQDKNEIEQLIRQAQDQYYQQHIKAIVETSPFLSEIGIRNFYATVNYLLTALLIGFPDHTYQQLKNNVEQRQPELLQKIEIERELQIYHQKLIARRDGMNKDLKLWYKADWKYFLQNPFRFARTRKKGYRIPRKKNYRPYHFDPKDSPYHQKNVLGMLSTCLQALAEKQRERAFSRKDFLLEKDKEYLAQHHQLDQASRDLARLHQAILQKDTDIEAKEAQLKQELEQLNRLTRIAELQCTIAEEDETLTSPAERFNELETLLAKKRQGK